MTKKKRWVAIAIACLLLAGVGCVIYIKTRPTLDELGPYFLNRCGKKDYATAEKLLENHPELVRYRLSEDGPTLLHVAADAWFETRPLELLLAHGADINAKDDLGRTPLNWTLMRGNTTAAEFLLAHGGTMGDNVRNFNIDDFTRKLKARHPDIKIVDHRSRPATEAAAGN